ncbi:MULTISPECIES: SDR family oxidoreductase [unclassified Vibrio]|uniref:SDR family oxidoreductase n=1 Tax=Vibrio sp. HB236076 TaxID=3232307 RepID=A0AB39HG16_9VIBR|nr:SDR family oxidoreductase [Vibrio sp. HB161653]MDP5254423.1 SDR family oxidoreductase [Vibrio sp. HB161653]
MSEKVILITGASSGIGEATARTLVNAGHKVVLTARRQARLDALVAEFGDHNALAIAADATDYQAQQQVVEAAIERFGRLDVAFANAGTGISQPGTENGDPNEWKKVIDININALLWTAHTTLPHLRASQGHFILTSSVAGRDTHAGSIYSSSKWFAYGFGQNLALEMAQWQGRCTTITPGMVNTAFFDQPKLDKLQPQDIADAVLYAISADPRANVREVHIMPSY